MFSSKNITKDEYLVFIKGLAKDRIYKNPNVDATNGGKLVQIIKMIEMGLERLCDGCLTTNARARRFYAREGFKETNHIKNDGKSICVVPRRD